LIAASVRTFVVSWKLEDALQAANLLDFVHEPGCGG
jgi:hypothetical protein